MALSTKDLTVDQVTTVDQVLIVNSMKVHLLLQKNSCVSIQHLYHYICLHYVRMPLGFGFGDVSRVNEMPVLHAVH